MARTPKRSTIRRRVVKRAKIEAEAVESVEAQPQSLADAMAAAGNVVEPAAEPVEVKHSILSDEEIAEARAEALRKHEKSKKDAARKQLVEEEMRRLQTEDGRVMGVADMDEEVEFTVDLPPFADRITVNGEMFMHGRGYRRPRHIANSILEQCFRAHRQHSETKGESWTEFYQKSAGLKLSPAGVIAGTVPTLGR